VRAQRLHAFIAILLAVSFAGCGKKGPPLAPLRLVPAGVSELAARQTGDDVELRFALPTTNANGPGQIDLARIEIYAITVGPGAVAPPNRDLLVDARLVGTIPVKPPPVEGETEKPGAPPDKRPGPGDQVTFVDQLNAAKRTPIVIPVAAVKGQKPPVAAGQPPVATATATATPTASATVTEIPAVPALPDAAETGTVQPLATVQTTEIPGQIPVMAAVPALPASAFVDPPVPPVPPVTYPTRIYAIRGISKGGRPGVPSARVTVPLIDAVAPPSAVAAQMPTANSVAIDWKPPVLEAGAKPLAFNIYRSSATDAPLNPQPIAEAKFDVGGVEYGKEQCFVVRTVQKIDVLTIESAPSAPACLTPLDKFPPAAPADLRAVAEDGAISLVWDQNTEPDLDGYLILRGEVPGGTLTPLTTQVVKDATYRDTTVKPGVRYMYAVVAVDNASPRNQSAASAREEVTAR
jgi:hypothetical protein